MTERSARTPRTAPAPVLLFAALLAAGCDQPASRGHGIALSECRLPRFAQAAQCGTLDVPEDRSRPGGRKIAIFVAVLPANTRSPQDDPLFLLAGGPGQAATQLAPFAAQLNEIRRTRDIVLVDQRGTGRSAPLECAAYRRDRRDPYEIDPLPKAAACAAELAARGVDAAQYTTTAWIADLEAVREALGYARINLWGGSYGTRVALEYLRRHPARVRSAVLDGVAPPSMRIPLDVWRTRDAALDAIFDACRRSAACAKAHPDPAATLAAIARELGADGRTADVADPQTGEVIRVPVTYDLVLAMLQPLTYAPELASLVPELLARAAVGDYAPLFAAAATVTGDLAEQVNLPLHYSVTCAEDVPRISGDERARALAGVRTGTLAARVLAVCDAWPKGALPADFATPVHSAAPVLLLSGALDPVTPPANAAEVAKALPASRHVVAADTGHIVSPHRCAPRLLAAFVDRASPDALPAACLERLERGVRPPFYVDRLAAQP
jgi:pimeloyl-ACP methyl ester carboxylesterase